MAFQVLSTWICCMPCHAFSRFWMLGVIKSAGWLIFHQCRKVSASSGTEAHLALGIGKANGKVKWSQTKHLVFKNWQFFAASLFLKTKTSASLGWNSWLENSISAASCLVRRKRPLRDGFFFSSPCGFHIVIRKRQAHQWDQYLADHLPMRHWRRWQMGTTTRDHWPCSKSLFHGNVVGHSTWPLD